MEKLFVNDVSTRAQIGLYTERDVAFILGVMDTTIYHFFRRQLKIPSGGLATFDMLVLMTLSVCFKRNSVPKEKAISVIDRMLSSYTHAELCDEKLGGIDYHKWFDFDERGSIVALYPTGRESNIIVSTESTFGQPIVKGKDYSIQSCYSLYCSNKDTKKVSEILPVFTEDDIRWIAHFHEVGESKFC